MGRPISRQDRQDPRRPGFRAGRAAPLSAVGLVLAGLFFLAALTPSLLPRDPVMQGVLAGVLATIGHEIGVACAWLWRFLGLPVPARRGRLLAAGAAVAVSAVGYGLSRAADWQDATRRMMGLDPVDAVYPLTIAGTGLAVALGLFVLARLFGVATRRAGRVLGRVVPPRVGLVIGVAVVGWLFWAVIDGVVLRRVLDLADASFAAADALMDPDTPAPADPNRTGSAASLVAWDEMGRWGRSYVTRTPGADEIAAFAGPDAMAPLRVYVGRRAAATPEDRAEIALAELIRQGGFDRAALVVTVPVGTGWMDPGAHDTLDFMLGGDVATVSVQYSYLTSVLSLWVAPEAGIAQARALFDAVYDHWTTLPRDARPKLYVHGLSQGAFNTQIALPLLDILADPIDGAMWAGSPFLSPLWQHVRDNRRPDSPEWRPRFGNGSLVRVANQQGGLDRFNAEWGPMRLVFLHYGTDAIVSFTFDSGLRRPGWMAPPRAFDVAPEFRWFPVVTMFQLALDMAISLQVPGYGHFYIAPDYIDAWAAVVEPEGWTPDRAAELKAIFAARPAPF
ncbi:alpha/beta hydrolase [Meridianimarinicoccus sp. RP-17]|uniref:alpha/beta hydrolase n=1 Tax=Meridianimarinicoccus zhengii TaxID=2056810 RepID=UPI000DAD7FE9|nr:alpha/beta-hydrolase family protein [Phycocomes zhengii]